MGAIHLATAALGTLVALHIAETGGSAEAASLVAASYSMGFLLGCFYTYKPLTNVGHVRAFTGAAALCSIFALLLSWTDNSVAMFLARFVIGIATAGLYAVGDAWINEAAPASKRGAILAIYSTILGIASVASQGVVALVSENLTGGFTLIAAVFSLSVVILALAGSQQPLVIHPTSVRLKEVFRDSPTACIGIFVNGIVVTVFLAILPYQAHIVGISSVTITTTIAMAYLGRIVFQVPLGRISDRMDRRLLIAGISLVATLTLLAVAMVVGSDVPVLAGDPSLGTRLVAASVSITLGGTLFPLYSVLTAHAMDRTVPVFVPSAAVTLLFIYTLGGAAGPILVAAISAAFDGRPMVWVICALMFLFTLFTALRVKQRPAVSRAEQAEMISATATSVEMAAVTKNKPSGFQVNDAESANNS